MPCRVGITTNPKRRKREWERLVIKLRNWQLHGCYQNKDDAQEEEDRLVQACFDRGKTCYGDAGGGDPDDEGWTVYSFDYTRERRK